MGTTESGHNVSMWLYHWTSLKGLATTTRKWHESEEVNKMFEIGRVGCRSSSFKSTRSSGRGCRHNEPKLGGVREWECQCLPSPHPDAYQPRLITV